MTQKAVIYLEVEKNDHKYSFTMPIGAPLGEVYDAAFEMLQEIVKLANEAVEKAEQKKVKKDKKEESTQ